MDQSSTTIRCSKRGDIAPHGFCTLVVDIETAEAALIFENEPSTPYEFIIDSIDIPGRRHVTPDDDEHIFFRNIANAIPRCTPNDVDFDYDERGRIISVTMLSSSPIQYVRTSGGVVSLSLPPKEFRYSGYLEF